jgi:hypothetical protein
MARLYLKRTLTGFIPADEPSLELAKKFKLGEIYRSDIVKPRSYQNHKLCMALLTLTFQNQDKYANFDMFRKAVAIEAGHVNEVIKLDGEVTYEAGSLSYDALDQVDFQKVFGSMMTVCCRLLKNIGADELEAEVSKYADMSYGS